MYDSQLPYVDLYNALLQFQSGRADGSDYLGPSISIERYLSFHQELGLQAPDVDTFHPFYHEIMNVRQSTEAAAPIQLVQQLWPPLMLGQMMFCRGGVAVSGGSDHVVKDVAERSTLYWTFRRKDRPYNDESQGWGHNSQWRTQLRRDYRTERGFHYNVDADKSLNAATEISDGMTVEAMRELVRNRCMIRTAIDDSDLYPYCYSDAEGA